MKTEWILVAITALAVAVYLGTLFIAPALQGGTQTYDVDGLKIVSHGVPREVLKELFSQPNMRLRMDLIDGTDERNPGVTGMGSEIAAAFGGMDREIQVYGYLSGKPYGCSAANGNCTGAQIIVRPGPCNCVRIDKEMVVEGDPAFLKDNVVKMRGIVRLILSDLGPAPSRTPSGPLSSLIVGVNSSA